MFRRLNYAQLLYLRVYRALGSNLRKLWRATEHLIDGSGWDLNLDLEFIERRSNNNHSTLRNSAGIAHGDSSQYI